MPSMLALNHLKFQQRCMQTENKALSGCLQDSNNCFASLQETEKHSVSAKTHDLNNCGVWSQEALSKRKNRDAHCSSHTVRPKNSTALHQCYKKAWHSMSAHRTQMIAALYHRRLWGSTKKAHATKKLTVSAEKQRQHNVRTHCLKIEVRCCCCCAKANKEKLWK